MSVNYKKLMHLMIDKNLSATQLQKQAQISGNVLTRIHRNDECLWKALKLFVQC